MVKKDLKKSNRLQGLKKKIRELTILCDVEAFFVVFEDEKASAWWPEDHHTCPSLIAKYRNSLKIDSSSNMEKKKMESESFDNHELQEMLRQIDRQQKLVDDRIDEYEYIFMGDSMNIITNEEKMTMKMECDGSCGLLNCIRKQGVEEYSDQHHDHVKGNDQVLSAGFSDEMNGYWKVDDEYDFGISLDDLGFVENDEFMIDDRWMDANRQQE